MGKSRNKEEIDQPPDHRRWGDRQAEGKGWIVSVASAALLADVSHFKFAFLVWNGDLGGMHK